MHSDVQQYFEKHATRRTFAEGEIIYHQGDATDAICYLESGLVLSYAILPNGRQKNLTFGWDGQLLNLADYVQNRPSNSYAVAAVTSTLLILSRSSMQECLERLPAAREELIQGLAESLDFLHNKAVDEALYDSDARIARFISRYIRRRWVPGQEGFPSMPFSQTVIADVVGISRSRVNKCFQTFSQRGWLSVGYGKIIILTPEKLEQFAFRDDIV